MVQPNLYDALKAIRNEDEEVCLWCDGICINQSDMAERNHQVGLMGKIYRSAKNVCVWLGPAEDRSDFVLDFVNRAEDNFRREKSGEVVDQVPNDEKQEFLKAFRALHKRPYWSRAWIKQEIILAKELVIHCGTKSANGLRLFVMAHWHCFWDHAISDEIANLSMHRANIRDGKRESLEVLLKRYGRTGCTDSRDRIFLILSIAADCERVEKKMADYSISLPALFFTILTFCEPQHILSLATQLHDILGVRRSKLLEYWNKIEDPNLEQGMQPPKTDSSLENLGIGLIWGIKGTRKLIAAVTDACPEYVDALEKASEEDLPRVCALIHLQPFWVRSSQLLAKGAEPEKDEEEKQREQEEMEAAHQDNSGAMALAIEAMQRASRQTLYSDKSKVVQKDYALLRIADTNFFVMARKTLFGLRFVDISKQVEDPTSDSGYSAEVFVPHIGSKKLKPFMIYPRIVLQKSGISNAAAGPSINLIIDQLILKRTFGASVMEPPIEVMCCILYELNRLSGKEGICTNDCRIVLEAYGFELNLLDSKLAQFRIQEEHEKPYGNRERSEM